MKDLKHFHQRCIERGVGVPPDALFRDLIHAHKTNNQDFLEYVCESESDAGIYRFFIGETPFYAVIGKDHFPRTLLTQHIVRQHKIKLKKRKKHGEYSKSKTYNKVQQTKGRKPQRFDIKDWE